jgi:ABC-type branched-subunit amino acid transport system substrate-binding protein
LAVVFLGVISSAPAAEAQSPQEVEIAVALSLTGEGTVFDPSLEGIQLAVEEANASGVAPRIKLTTYDDQGSDDIAKELANQIAASPAVLVLGPSYSTASLAAGPIYAEAGMISLPPTATSDLISQNPTTFRVIFKNSDQGETLATYLFRVLGQRRAVVFVEDDAYGHTLQEGFQRTAERLELEADYYLFSSVEEGQAIARRIAADPSPPPIVLLTLELEGAEILATLRRMGVTGPFLGGDALGGQVVADRLAAEPEAQTQPGFFTDNLYGLSPVILDSANADTLAFAERFRIRFGHDPSWETVAGYDAASIAIIALQAVAARSQTNLDVAAYRAAVLNYLASLKTPAQAKPGLLGPFWFDETRARQQAIRVGQFRNGQLESAPLQIVLVAVPDPAELASGAVFELGPGRYARLQRVVYTGVFLNEVPHVDLANSSFGADFYLWLRFAGNAGPDSADPTDLIFPTMIDGSFERDQPTKQRRMADGTEYWLWRVQGEFRNDFDLRRFPFDQQALSLSFFNVRAPMEQVVYVVDRHSLAAGPISSPSSASPGGAPAAQAAPATPPSGMLSVASAVAFRKLTQWDSLGVRERRENLVAHSALGDPTFGDLEGRLELSGFLVTIDLQRRIMATLIKSLLPLVLMTLILYASLYFLGELAPERIAVAIGGALSAAVLLTEINDQLGGIGYTVAVEYVFYVFFGLSLLSVLSVLVTNPLRAAGRDDMADRTERWTRFIFLLAVAGTVAGTLWYYWNQ